MGCWAPLRAQGVPGSGIGCVESWAGVCYSWRGGEGGMLRLVRHNLAHGCYRPLGARTR